MIYRHFIFSLFETTEFRWSVTDAAAAAMHWLWLETVSVSFSLRKMHRICGKTLCYCSQNDEEFYNATHTWMINWNANRLHTHTHHERVGHIHTSAGSHPYPVRNWIWAELDLDHKSHCNQFRILVDLNRKSVWHEEVLPYSDIYICT